MTVYEKGKGKTRRRLIHANADEIASVEQPVLSEFSYKVIAFIQWCVEFIFGTLDLENEYPGGGGAPMPMDGKWGEDKWGEFKW